MGGGSGLHPVFSTDDASNSVFAHQPGHTRPGSLNARLLQFHRNSGAARTAIALLVNLWKPVIAALSGSEASWVREPVIIATDTHSEHAAHLLWWGMDSGALL